MPSAYDDFATPDLLTLSYGWDFETPFFRRSWAEREAVIAAMVLVLRGPDADRALGSGGRALAKTAEFRPFVEILRAVKGREEVLWERVRRWPVDMQDRAGGALRYVESERAKLGSSRRRLRSIGQVKARALGGPGMQVPAGR